jgi:hypothetical protein
MVSGPDLEKTDMMDNVQNIAQEDYCTLKEEATGSSKMCMLHSITIQNTIILKLAILCPHASLPTQKNKQFTLSWEAQGAAHPCQGTRKLDNNGESCYIKPAEL